MIESKFKTWGILAIVMTLLLSVFIIIFIYVLISTEFFDGHFFKSKGTLTPFEIIVFVLVFLLMQLFLVRAWLMYFFFITIDSVSKVISFKNIFTQHASHYRFQDVDGYLDIVGRSKYGSYKVLYLIKDKKALLTISGYYYANMDEMQEALSSITYLGLQENWRQISRRALFDKPLLD